MTGRRRRSSLERTLYRAARAAGDVDAARRGPDVLVRRVVRRRLRRSLFRLLRG